MSSDSSEAFCSIFHGMLFSNCFTRTHGSVESQYCCYKRGIPNGNHMNNDVAEV